MKTVLDKTTREELIGRINTLDENSARQWGKMNINQMLKHCAMVDEMFLGRKQYKRTFLGRLIGQMALKSMLKDQTPIAKNAPTSPYFKIKESSGDVASEKQEWIELIEEYGRYSNNNFVHWFFGKMTNEQVGYFAYKHIDHHLRQFNS
jgi:hypothetical protein